MLSFVKFQATESQPNINGGLASTTTDVQINIIDVNDNPPLFYKCEGPEDKPVCVIATQFTGEVFEHTTGSIPINMMVRDLDKVRGGKKNPKKCPLNDEA